MLSRWQSKTYKIIKSDSQKNNRFTVAEKT
jgi:hypothetical protein